MPKPDRKLGKHGSALWRAVQAEYHITDTGGAEMLLLACEALDRAEACRKAIDTDGVIIDGKSGPRDHPALKHELANRAFVVRTLQRLGLDVEPIRAKGRPPADAGWKGGKHAH